MNLKRMQPVTAKFKDDRQNIYSESKQKEWQ